MTAQEHARDLFLRLAAISPEQPDDIANLLVFSFDAAMRDEREQCAKVAEWTDHGENRPKAKAANDRIAAAIRARALVAEQREVDANGRS